MCVFPVFLLGKILFQSEKRFTSTNHRSSAIFYHPIRVKLKTGNPQTLKEFNGPRNHCSQSVGSHVYSVILHYIYPSKR